MTLMTANETLLQAADVTARSRISFRQLDYWVRRGLIKPTVEARGEGSVRLFHPSVVDEIRELVERIEACPFHPHGGRRRP